MHVVIMGCGRVGSTLAHSLESRGHSVAVIDQDPDAFRRLGPDFAGITVTGVGFDRRGAARRPASSGPTRSRRCPAATTPTSSRPGWPARRSACHRVVGPHLRPSAPQVYERLGIPTVATVRWTADRMLRAPGPRGHVETWRDPTGTVSIIEVPVHKDWIGRPLRAAGGGRRRPGGLPGPVRHRHAAHRLHRRAGGRPGLHAGHRRHRRLGHVGGGGAAGRRALSHADRHRRRRQRGPLDRPGADRQRPPGDADRAAAAGCCGPTGCPAADWVLADACELASLEEADVAGVRRGGRRHRRRQGQPRGVAAGQDRVRGAAAWWPGSTGPRTSGCSPSSGASTSRSASRA